MNNRIIFTGGPGTGKTTVLNVLEARGFHCVSDVAREIIRARLDSGLSPRPEPEVFAKSIFDADVVNYQSAPSSTSKVCFFDRGLVDSLGMLYSCGSLSDDEIDVNLSRYPYNKVVFVFPPWQEIYRTDTERDQSWEESVAVFDSVSSWYTRCEYRMQLVPIGTPQERVTFIESSGLLPKPI